MSIVCKEPWGWICPRICPRKYATGVDHCQAHFFSIVRAQPSTDMSCVAAKKLNVKKTYVSATMFMSPFSGNHSSRSLAANIKTPPEKSLQLR